MDRKKTLNIQTNSAGELSSWVSPICHCLNTYFPDIKVDLYIVPCQYATGKEFEVASKLPAIRNIYTPKESIKRMLFPKKHTNQRNNNPILVLGGDPIYSKIFAKRTDSPLFIYTEKDLPKQSGKATLLTRSKIGDLMSAKKYYKPKNSDQLFATHNLDPHKDYCTFFPGSRQKHFEELVPLFAKSVNHIHKTDPHFQAIFAISPFIDIIKNKNLINKFSSENIQFIQGDPTPLIQVSKMLVTIPGTNTAEGYYLSTPMVTIFPLNNPNILPFDGLIGLLGKLPIIGRLIKKGILNTLIKKRPYFSLPNIMTNSSIVPELIKKTTPEEIAHFIMATYNNQTQLDSQRLAFEQNQPKYDVAKKIISEIIANSGWRDQ